MALLSPRLKGCFWAGLHSMVRLHSPTAPPVRSEALDPPARLRPSWLRPPLAALPDCTATIVEPIVPLDGTGASMGPGRGKSSGHAYSIQRDGL